MINYYGIDLGDGETSAAGLYGERAIQDLSHPEQLTLANKQSILTVVGTRAGKPVVGDAAIIGGAQVFDVRSRFKSRYLTDPAESGRNVNRFAKGLMELMDGKLAAGEYELALGCPAGWPESTRAEYAKLAADAGFQNLHPVSESRAAFLYAHYSAGLSRENLQRSTLVIDFGSSTIDFAYIVDGKQNNVGVFGDTLGGGLLDRCIYDAAAENSRLRYQKDAFSDAVNNATWRNLGELRAREQKEKYFSIGGKTPLQYTFSIFKDAGAPVVLNFTLREESMNRILDTKLEELQGKSFREGLNDSLRRAKEKTKEKPPEILLLTGGASRMTFFREACREVFPEAHILLDSEPAFSISRGLAIAACIDSRLTVFKEEVAAYLRSGKIAAALSANIAPLMTEIRPLLQTLIFDECVLPAIREMEPKAGTEAFEKAFLVNCEKVFAWKEKTEELNGKLREWVPRTLSDRGVERDLGSICDTYGVDRPSLMPAEIAGDLIHIESMKPNKSFWFVCRVISYGFDVKAVRGMAKRLLRKRINRVIDEATGVNGEFAPRLADDIAVQLSARIHENAGRIEMLIQDD